jgi:hypothetical protein
MCAGRSSRPLVGTKAIDVPASGFFLLHAAGPVEVSPGAVRGQRIVGGNLAHDLLNTQNGPAGAAPEDVLSD